jgi:BirA family biotin operon repressor/biotin-[acetyl-CoA-carboxylase] ligase
MFTREIIRFDSVESTNDKARELLMQKKFNEGAVVLANEQTKGRGHGQNTWESEKGENLTFSLILRPGFIEITSQFIISKAISLAIRDMIALYTSDVNVKWPNDIYIGDKKIAGILIENSVLNNRIEYCIAGIGININQEVFTSDAPNPRSLIHITGKEIDLNETFDLVYQFLEKRYMQLKSGESQLIDKEYLTHLYRINKVYDFVSKGRKFKGKITGIDKFGKLLIETGPEEVHKFDFNEVLFA